MGQIICGCGCNNVIPDVVMLALDSRFGYGGSGHRQPSMPEALCPRLVAEAVSPVEYRQAA
jgi:hypothetical protein